MWTPARSVVGMIRSVLSWETKKLTRRDLSGFAAGATKAGGFAVPLPIRDPWPLLAPALLAARQPTRRNRAGEASKSQAESAHKRQAQTHSSAATFQQQAHTTANTPLRLAWAISTTATSCSSFFPRPVKTYIFRRSPSTVLHFSRHVLESRDPSLPLFPSSIHSSLERLRLWDSEAFAPVFGLEVRVTTRKYKLESFFPISRSHPTVYSISNIDIASFEACLRPSIAAVNEPASVIQSRKGNPPATPTPAPITTACPTIATAAVGSISHRPPAIAALRVTVRALDLPLTGAQ